ncbi:MAG: hypothetical protein AABY27_04650 [Pseudomonadota bacterium]
MTDNIKAWMEKCVRESLGLCHDAVVNILSAVREEKDLAGILRKFPNFREACDFSSDNLELNQDLFQAFEVMHNNGEPVPKGFLALVKQREREKVIKEQHEELKQNSENFKQQTINQISVLTELNKQLTDQNSDYKAKLETTEASFKNAISEFDSFRKQLCDAGVFCAKIIGENSQEENEEF